MKLAIVTTFVLGTVFMAGVLDLKRRTDALADRLDDLDRRVGALEQRIDAIDDAGVQ